MPRPINEIRQHLERFFPEYALLSDEQKQAFEATPTGQLFVASLGEELQPPAPGVLRLAMSGTVKATGLVVKGAWSLVRGTTRWLTQPKRNNVGLEDARDEAIRQVLLERQPPELEQLRLDIQHQQLMLAQRLHEERITWFSHLSKHLKDHQLQIESFWQIISTFSDDEVLRILSGYYTQHLVRISVLYESLLKHPSDIQRAFQTLTDQFLSDFLPYFSAHLFGRALPQELAKPSLRQHIQSSLITFFMQKKWKDLYVKIKRIGNAHALIQYMGFSTQNEASHLALLDIFNYFEHGEKVDDLRGLFSRITRLFSSLYQEYEDIFRPHHVEQGALLKTIRALIPLLILTSVVVLILTPLAILGTPDIALFFVAAVAIVIGLGLATCYVNMKNKVSQWLLRQRYPDEFDSPDYAVNPRLMELFGEHAPEVRAVYIEMLKEAKTTRAHYKTLSVLENEEQRLARDTNLKQMVELALEWADLHDNVECSRVEAYRIVQRHYKMRYEHHIADVSRGAQAFGKLMRVCMQPSEQGFGEEIDEQIQRIEAHFGSDEIQECWGNFWKQHRTAVQLKSRYDLFAPQSS